MTTTSTTTSLLGVLAGQEIRNYLRAKLFWAGVVLLTAVTAIGFVDAARSDTGGDQASTAMDMIAPAALLGVFGLIVLAGLTKRSDRAAAAAGSVAVPERTRTVALAAAVVVPLTAGLLWFAAALVAYQLNPPSPATVPFGPIGDGYVFVVMFALGVVPAAGGPLLGLLIARWLPRRGVTALAVVLVVLVTIVMQGNFEATWHWRMVWPWTYWYGPVGWHTGNGHWAALPGSPQLWLVYLVGVCALGVLVAIYHDPESDRGRLRTLIAGVLVVAVVALVLSMTLGLDEAVYNPITGPGA
jgi:hypothetical protein